MRPRLGKCRGYVVVRNVAEFTSVIQVQVAELCAAEPSCVRQHGIEDGLQFSRRTTDDAEHLRGRRLLLQCFSQIVGALAQLVEQAGVLDGDDGLAGEVRD